MRKRYKFKGYVKLFNIILNNNWEAETYAASPKKAMSNLAFRFKQNHGYTPDCKITLNGKLLEVL